MKRIGIVFLIGILMASSVWAGQRKPVKSSAKDKCPVCGMFVAKYPDFFAEVLFKDGSYAVFDGAKDMFKYYLTLSRYAPARKYEDIDSVYVTDYYSLELIDGFRAYYVTGSDICGPMGKELIPTTKEADAKGFMKDHGGKTVLRWKNVTARLVRRLD